jgi:hypothetical protein
LTANLGGEGGPSGRDGGMLTGESFRDAKETAGHAAWPFASEGSLFLRIDRSIDQQATNDKITDGTYESSVTSCCRGSLGEDPSFHLPGDRDTDFGDGDNVAE